MDLSQYPNAYEEGVHIILDADMPVTQGQAC